MNTIKSPPFVGNQRSSVARFIHWLRWVRLTASTSRVLPCATRMRAPINNKAVCVSHSMQPHRPKFTPHPTCLPWNGGKLQTCTLTRNPNRWSSWTRARTSPNSRKQNRTSAPRIGLLSPSLKAKNVCCKQTRTCLNRIGSKKWTSWCRTRDRSSSWSRVRTRKYAPSSKKIRNWPRI